MTTSAACAGWCPTGASIPVIAPAGFLEHAVSENVYAGTAMTRRAVYMYGAELPRGAAGQVGAGLGLTTSTGTISLIPPTLDITRTGQEEVVDGVRIVFQLTPGTEAPSEMNFYFPDKRALCMAENATHNLHNLLTLRGAVVRNPHTWARYLTETIELFGGETDVVFASHHWPTWGQRADQDVPDPAARPVRVPARPDAAAAQPGLHRQRDRRDDGAAARAGAGLAHPRLLRLGQPQRQGDLPALHGLVRRQPGAPVGTSARSRRRNGTSSTWAAPTRSSRRRRSVDDGDQRWAAQVLNYVVFADPGNVQARELLAGVYDSLGYGAENATWRNFFLQGAAELRGHMAKTKLDTTNPDMAMALTVDQVFDSLAIRVNGPKAWDKSLSIDWNLTDLRKQVRLELSNGALIQTAPRDGEPAQLRLTLTKPALLKLLATRRLDGITADGDQQALVTLIGLLDTPDKEFPIVTP